MRAAEFARPSQPGLKQRSRAGQGGVNGDWPHALGSKVDETEIFASAVLQYQIYTNDWQQNSFCYQ